MTETETTVREFWVYFTDNTLEPIPVRAESRTGAFRIGERYSGPLGDYRHSGVAAAVDKEGGGAFEDVSGDEFVTDEDV